MTRGLRSTLLVLAAAALVAGPAAGARDDDRIINGTPATQGEYPAHGYLAVDDGSGTFPLQCGGSLVSSEWFLTAAHCVSDFDVTKPPSSFFVFMGDVDLDPPNDAGNFFDVVAVDRYAPYNPDTLENDLAMLKLERPAPHQPIRVIRTNETAKWADGVIARIIGWGVTESGQPSDELLEADAPMRADSVCQSPSSYGPTFFASSMVCAGDGSTDTCQGDSGGPLMVPDNGAFVLVGVTSWGQGCADAQFPGVYARLGAPALNAWVVGPRPEARFTWTPAHAGHPVTLTSTSFNPEAGDFDTFSWDFDADGQFDDATGASVTHTFPSRGLPQVSMRASKVDGDWASTTQFVSVNGLPVADQIGPYAVREGASVALVASGSDPEGQAVTYAWDLDGNGSFENPNRIATFSALRIDGPADRTAVQQVCDVLGVCARSATGVHIRNAAPRVNAGRDRRVRRRQRVRFRVRASDPGLDRLRYRWTCGNRARGSGRTVTCRYRRAGRYVIRVTVTDGDGGVGRDLVRVRVRR
ncbi:MAG TPA: trypsin-like serine protease [Gaiellaceae bacterium]|jgi:V8-like Glu-specific endopeptidase